MTGGFLYGLIYCLVRTAFFFWHPVYRVIGREHVPESGKLVICANHSGMADPLWAVLSLRMGHIPRIMAKKEAESYPVLGWILKKLGVFFVDRDGVDVQAIKTGLRCLRDEQQLLIFPEGTRVKDRSESNPKRGAVMLAARTGAPVLPMYLSRRTGPLSPVTVVIGEPYHPVSADVRASDEELTKAAQELMNRIYEMGEAV